MKMIEFLFEGFVGTLVVLVLPGILLLAIRELEKREKRNPDQFSILSTLQNKIYDEITRLNK